MRLSSLFFPSLLESCADARVLAVVFAERADEEQLARGLASVQGFAAHACACVFSPARQERAAATAAAHGASVVRVEGADESSYRTACLLSCLGASPLPASCSRSTYALALEPDAILQRSNLTRHNRAVAGSNLLKPDGLGGHGQREHTLLTSTAPVIVECDTLPESHVKHLQHPRDHVFMIHKRSSSKAVVFIFRVGVNHTVER